MNIDQKKELITVKLIEKRYDGQNTKYKTVCRDNTSFILRKTSQAFINLAVSRKMLNPIHVYYTVKHSDHR